jgi:hypothetical protein
MLTKTKEKQSQVGDVRDFAGVTFRATEELKTFDGKPRGIVWTAEPAGIASRVDESWHTESVHRFAANAIHCRTFEAAAMRALKYQASKARRYREFLAVYDAPALAEARAKVDLLG